MTKSRSQFTACHFRYNVDHNIERIRSTFQHILCCIGRYGSAGSSWIQHEFGTIVLCFICVYFGVISTTWLSPILLAHMYFPEMSGLMISPLAAIPITILVCTLRAYPRWHAASSTPLGVRMMRACSDGVTWPFWCWRNR
jgi:hypothetical protein